MKKKKRTTFLESYRQKKRVCYICHKIIKTIEYYSIGKDKNEIDLYRHKKCNPNKKKRKTK